MGAALLLGLVIVVAVFYAIIARSLGTGENVAPYTAQQGIPATISTAPPETTAATDAGGAPVETAPNTVTTIAAILVRPKATVSSSALQGTAIASFQATNLLDSDLSTPWQEGAKGTGQGEWVRFDLSEPMELSSLQILNGYQKDDQRYLGTPRVRLIKVEYSSGATQLVELADVKDPQIIESTTEAVEWVKVIIVSVYPGGQWEDAAISEVRIYEKAG